MQAGCRLRCATRWSAVTGVDARRRQPLRLLPPLVAQAGQPACSNQPGSGPTLWSTLSLPMEQGLNRHSVLALLKGRR
jgi:hypothetical protein